MKKFDAFRRTAARWLSFGCAALLAYSIVALIIAWSLAAQDGWIPQRWGEADGNHGPWRHYYPGRTLVGHAMMAPLGALAVGALSYFARPATGVTVLIGIAIVEFFAIASTHFWLVD